MPIGKRDPVPVSMVTENYGPKTGTLAKKWFVCLFVKIFKNKKLIKKVRKHSLDTGI